MPGELAGREAKPSHLTVSRARAASRPEPVSALVGGTDGHRDADRGWAGKQLVLMQRLAAGSGGFWGRKQPEDVRGGAGGLAQGGALPRPRQAAGWRSGSWTVGGRGRVPIWPGAGSVPAPLISSSVKWAKDAFSDSKSTHVLHARSPVVLGSRAAMATWKPGRVRGEAGKRPTDCT